MSQSEKRFFNLNASKFVKKDTRTVDLFNAFNTLKDTVKVKAKFSSLPDNTFAIYKQRLFEQLLESLYLQNSVKDYRAEALKKLAKIRLLYRKNLKEDCISLLKRLVTYCLKHNCYLELLEVYELLLNVYHSVHITNSSYLEKLEEVQLEIDHTINVITEKLGMQKVINKKFSWTYRNPVLQKQAIKTDDYDEELISQSINSEIGEINDYKLFQYGQFLALRIWKEIEEDKKVALLKKFEKVVVAFKKGNGTKFSYNEVHKTLSNFCAITLNNFNNYTLFENAYNLSYALLRKNLHLVDSNLQAQFISICFTFLTNPIAYNKLSKKIEADMLKFHQQKLKQFNPFQNLLIYENILRYQICNELFEQASNTIGDCYINIPKIPVNNNLFFPFKFFELLFAWRQKNFKLSQSVINAIKYQLKSNNKFLGNNKQYVRALEKIQHQFKNSSTANKEVTELFELNEAVSDSFFHSIAAKTFFKKGFE